MKDLIVAMGASEVRGEMAEYHRQLTAAGIDYHVEPIIDMPNSKGGGTLGFKVKGLRELATRFSNYENLILSDAWDVLFYGEKQDVIVKIPEDYVLMAAERNCYPEPQLTWLIKGNTPWRYVNGGLTAGRPEVILRWLTALEAHPSYDPNMLDQAFFNRLLAAGSELVEIDDTTELFYCLILEQGELQSKDGLPFNSLCGTYPQFIHANGGCKR